MKVLIASDHAGFALKEKLKKALAGNGQTVEDLGPNSVEPVDYPDFAHSLAKRVAKGGCFGILVCGTGIGMSIAANRTKGVRAALCWSEETARLSREHNNANVLCLGARALGEGEAERIADAFLNTKFSGEERHLRRISKIDSAHDQK